MGGFLSLGGGGGVAFAAGQEDRIASRIFYRRLLGFLRRIIEGDIHVCVDVRWPATAVVVAVVT